MKNAGQLRGWTDAPGFPLAAVLLAGAAAGCAARVDDAGGAPRVVGLAEFAGPTPRSEPAVARDAAPAVAAAFALGAGNTADASPADPGAGPPPARMRPGERVVVESLIGQVNGRPIFADTFFEPLEDELIALRAELDDQQFAIKTREIVKNNLQQVLLSDLFLSEAESGLGQAEQQGLLYWLDRMREDVVSKMGGGTVSEAERELRAEEGVSLDEFLDQRKESALIRQLLDQRIAPRVVVSWRDVEREYERRYDEFNPPAEVELARIRLSTSRDTEAIAGVTERLDRGEAFREVAESLDQWNEGAWQTFTLGPGGLADIELTELARQHVGALEVGETTPPFEIGTSTWWLHVTTMNRSEGRSLYDPDLQQHLADELYNRRAGEERQKYIESLIDEDVFAQLNEMAERLLIIALLRYGDV